MARGKKSTFERLQYGSMNRAQRRELRERLSSADPGLTVVHGDAGGIDVGSESHFVAVPADRDEQSVREFGSWTGDLRRMAEWLRQCGIRTVALQATGVYWIGLQEVLEEGGIKVYVVNARGTKNLPGRKSDVQECQWLMKLHTYGLLRDSFRPPEEIRAVRTIWRQRGRLVEEAGRTVQQMQKALTKMNVQLTNTISDISGVSGQAIIRAILKGERDPKELAKLRNERVKASEEEVALSLEGKWREDVIFELRQVMAAYDFYQGQMKECDRELEKCMAALPNREIEGSKAEEVAEEGRKGKRRKPRSKNEPRFELGAELRRTLGADLSCIDGISNMTAQMILSELGPDLSAFPDEDHFASWLQLAPKHDITAGKVIRKVKAQGRHRVANALRMSAETLSRSDSYLGARYRRLRGRMDGAKAVKAMARYLACLVYRLLRKGKEYVDRGEQYFETKRQEREMSALKRRATALGMTLVPVAK
jgi:transposase